MSFNQDRISSQSSLTCRSMHPYKSKFKHIHAPIHHKKYQPNENYFTSYITPPTYRSRFPYAFDCEMKPSMPNIPIPKPYSLEDTIRQKVAVENTSFQYDLIDRSYVETIYDKDHITADVRLGLPPRFRQSPIYITKKASANAAIAFHMQDETYKICILNFADSFEPGNGFKYGHKSQETSVCLQTLVYPTLVDNRMYNINMNNGQTAEACDIMIYSHDVYLIRDQWYKRIDPFLINIITSPPVDNSKRVIAGALKMMERRIRKIVRLAAYKKNDILILGDFGCGPFKNDPKAIAQILYKILVIERMKDHFTAVVLPIYFGVTSYKAFVSAFSNAKFF